MYMFTQDNTDMCGQYLHCERNMNLPPQRFSSTPSALSEGISLWLWFSVYGENRWQTFCGVGHCLRYGLEETNHLLTRS